MDLNSMQKLNLRGVWISTLSKIKSQAVHMVDQKAAGCTFSTTLNIRLYVHLVDQKAAGCTFSTALNSRLYIWYISKQQVARSVQH